MDIDRLLAYYLSILILFLKLLLFHANSTVIPHNNGLDGV